MNIVGLHLLSHDSSCAVIKNGKLTSAYEEEKLSRIKHDSGVPVRAFNTCLRLADIITSDIECIAISEDPFLKFERQCKTFKDLVAPPAHTAFLLNPHRIEYAIRNQIGFDGIIGYHSHHDCHAHMASYFAPFEFGDILVIDAVGEEATTSYFSRVSGGLQLHSRDVFPNSLGLFYSTLTHFLGFEVNEGEYKVMGLSSYGRPRFVSLVSELIKYSKDGKLYLAPEYFSFTQKDRMFTERLIQYLGIKPRQKDSQILQEHLDLAFAAQKVLEDSMLKIIRNFQYKTGGENLIIVGGVALNCKAISILRESKIYKNIFVPPASGDSGSSIGAALISLQSRSGNRSWNPLASALLGPTTSSNSCRVFLDALEVPYCDYSLDEEGLCERIARSLYDGHVIGWYRGAAEFGPRALGTRSIFADPRFITTKDKVNLLIKGREMFRPFAPIVTCEDARKYFDIVFDNPYMTDIFNVKFPHLLEAVSHTDNTARVQTLQANESPTLYKLLRAFERKSGLPILLNTSFNIKDEPIVGSIDDAFRCFIASGLDVLVLDSMVIERSLLSPSLRMLKDKLLCQPLRNSGTYSFF